MDERTVTLYRISQRRTDDSKVRRQIEEIIQRGLAGVRAKHFKVQKWTTPHPQSSPSGWVYRITLQFTPTGYGSAHYAKTWESVVRFIEVAAKSRGGWSVELDNTATAAVNDQLRQQQQQATVPATVASVPETPIGNVNLTHHKHYFSHLYGLEAQISVVLSALQVAKDTGYKKRYHSVLWGKPGCGKSEILHGIKAMAGEGNVIEFDGTQTTAAGAIRALVDAPVIPPVLIIEEIEKVPDAPFLWLLSALDGRTEIRKTTIRGTIHRKVPFVCVATVNDLELFESRHDGAMASRFSHKIYCPRPNAATLRKILMREIESMDGDPKWVEPALRYCIDVENNTDPRRVIAVCLTGRDDLLTGKFQDNLKACMPRMEK